MLSEIELTHMREMEHKTQQANKKHLKELDRAVQRTKNECQQHVFANQRLLAEKNDLVKKMQNEQKELEAKANDLKNDLNRQKRIAK